jgi:hypothetical protein
VLSEFQPPPILTCHNFMVVDVVCPTTLGTIHCVASQWLIYSFQTTSLGLTSLVGEDSYVRRKKESIIVMSCLCSCIINSVSTCYPTWTELNIRFK